MVKQIRSITRSLVLLMLISYHLGTSTEAEDFLKDIADRVPNVPERNLLEARTYNLIAVGPEMNNMDKITQRALSHWGKYKHDSDQKADMRAIIFVWAKKDIWGDTGNHFVLLLCHNRFSVNQILKCLARPELGLASLAPLVRVERFADSYDRIFEMVDEIKSYVDYHENLAEASKAPRR